MTGVATTPISGLMLVEITSALGTVLIATFAAIFGLTSRTPAVVLLMKLVCQSLTPLSASKAYRLSWQVATNTTLWMP